MCCGEVGGGVGAGWVHMLIRAGEKLAHGEYVIRFHIQRSEDISRHIKHLRK